MSGFQSALCDGAGAPRRLGTRFTSRSSAALFERSWSAPFRRQHRGGCHSRPGSTTCPLPSVPIVLTFLARATDIDPHVVKRNFASSVTIGLMGFSSRLISAACCWHITGLAGHGRKRRSQA